MFSLQPPHTRLSTLFRELIEPPIKIPVGGSKGLYIVRARVIDVISTLFGTNMTNDILHRMGSSSIKGDYLEEAQGVHKLRCPGFRINDNCHRSHGGRGAFGVKMCCYVHLPSL